MIGWFWCFGLGLRCVVFMLLLDLVMSYNNVCIYSDAFDRYYFVVSSYCDGWVVLNFGVWGVLGVIVYGEGVFGFV